MNALEKLLKDDWGYPECPGCMIDCEFEPEIFDLEKCKSKKQFKSYREVHVRTALLEFAKDLENKERKVIMAVRYEGKERIVVEPYKEIATEIRNALQGIKAVKK